MDGVAFKKEDWRRRRGGPESPDLMPDCCGRCSDGQGRDKVVPALSLCIADGAAKDCAQSLIVDPQRYVARSAAVPVSCLALSSQCSCTGGSPPAACQKSARAGGSLRHRRLCCRLKSTLDDAAGYGRREKVVWQVDKSCVLIPIGATDDPSPRYPRNVSRYPRVDNKGEMVAMVEVWVWMPR